MGYRHHLYAVPKKQIAEIQVCKTNQDWLDFAKRHSYKIDYGARDDGIGYFAPHELQSEIYDLGKYSEIGHELEEARPCVFTSQELKDTYSDYGFALCSKEDFKAIIKAYKQKIVNYFKELLDAKEEDSLLPINQPKEEKWRYAIESKLRYWQVPWALTPINLDENSDYITHSWLYEYSIFELVRLYKTFDWENNDLVLMGW